MAEQLPPLLAQIDLANLDGVDLCVTTRSQQNATCLLALHSESTNVEATHRLCEEILSGTFPPKLSPDRAVFRNACFEEPGGAQGRRQRGRPVRRTRQWTQHNGSALST